MYEFFVRFALPVLEGVQCFDSISEQSPVHMTMHYLKRNHTQKLVMAAFEKGDLSKKTCQFLSYTRAKLNCQGKARQGKFDHVYEDLSSRKHERKVCYCISVKSVGIGQDFIA